MSVEDSRLLWAAVDSITQPTRRKLVRVEDADWLEELAKNGQGSFCRVADYRAAMLAYGEIPALWHQAEWALTTGSEKSEGGSSPLRERSPADLDLMETMLTIRESMSWQLKGRQLTPRPTLPEQMRQLASHIAGHEPQHIEWWTYRFEQWSRLLATHLRAMERAPKPVRLRNAPCPVCRTKQLTIEEDGENKVVPPLLIDFVDGHIRAAQCIACMSTWWRGAELNELADLINTPNLAVVAEAG